MNVYKLVLTPERHKYEMPEGATLLHIAEQYGHVCLWFLCNPKNKPVERHIVAYGTGHDIPYTENQMTHIGSVLIENGALVFHIFEINKVS